VRRALRSLPVVSPERLLVLVAAAGLVASYVLTWPLWQERSYPPELPALSIPVSFGVLLIVAAGVAALFPRVGAIAHTVLLAVAMVADQTRLQPEFVSLAIVLTAGAWPRSGVHVARWHLIALWFWAGVHKVLSGGWPSGAAAFIAASMGLQSFTVGVAILVPLTEIGLGLLGLRPGAWRVLRWAASAFHLGTFAVLALARFNSAVWPWNLALAVAAPLLFVRPASERPAGLPRGRRGTVLTAAAVLLVLHPLGFYIGATDAYIAHNLYTSNTGEGYTCSGQGEKLECQSLVSVTYRELNVPLPPEKRLFGALFDGTCSAGDRLELHGRWIRFAEREVDSRPCRPGRSP
jgi:hypothetical protein